VILNPYAALDGLVSLMRLGLGVVVSFLAASLCVAGPRPAPEERAAREARSYLLYLLAGLLLALNVLSWPLLYLLLQSYVTEWPGVMCVYGVTRVGANSLGISRLLPPLLTTLQAAKPLIVFASGAWLVLYLINRRTRTAPLSGRVALVVAASAMLASADALAELAYLFIPKKEEFLEAGCCTALFLDAGPSRFLPRALFGPDAEPWVWAAYYACNAAFVAALLAGSRAARWGLPRAWLGPACAGAMLTAGADLIFAADVAAPRLLQMPGHTCLYDLIPRAPEAIAALAFGLGGCLFAAWGCVAGWLAGGDEAAPFVPATVAGLFRLAALAAVLSTVLMSVELSLA
jgi:hypothetical protein